MNGDKDLAIQSLAADNARLCDRLIAAERVIDFARRLQTYTTLRRLIAEYDAGRAS